MLFKEMITGGRSANKEYANFKAEENWIDEETLVSAPEKRCQWNIISGNSDIT